MLIGIVSILLLTGIPVARAQNVWDPENMNEDEIDEKSYVTPEEPMTRAPFEFIPWTMAVTINDGALNFFLAGQHSISLNFEPWMEDDTISAVLSKIANGISPADTLQDTTEMFVCLDSFLCAILEKPYDTLHLRIMVNDDEYGRKSVETDVLETVWFMNVAQVKESPDDIEMVLRFEAHNKGTTHRLLREIRRNGFGIVEPLDEGWYILESETGQRLVHLEPSNIGRHKKINIDPLGNIYVLVNSTPEAELTSFEGRAEILRMD